MAFTQQEKSIIEWGKANGKSQQEVEQALIRFRSGVIPSKSELHKPGILSRVGTAIQTAGRGVQEAISAEGDFAGRSSVRRGFDAAAQAARGVVNVGIETLPEPARTGIEKIGEKVSGAVDWLSDKIGSTEAAQKFVSKYPDAAKALEEIAGISSSAGEVSGSLLAISSGARIANKSVNATRSASGKAVETGKNISEGALDTAKGAISKAKSWVQQPVKASVQTVLKETPVKTFDSYTELARKAALNNKNPTPLEFAGTRAQEALDQINRKLANVGREKSAIVSSSAGRTPVGNIVVQFRQQLQNSIRNKVQVEGNKKVYQDVLVEAERLGVNPIAAQVDRFIDFVQDRIYTGRRDLMIPITDDVQQTLRPRVGELNAALKSKMPPSYSNLNTRYSELVETRNELNVKLGAEGEKGGSLMKRVFSPSDANTKRLFADVLDETGIDLVNEATLARYVMDILGDARQKSMLEQLNLSLSKPSASSVTTRILDYLIEKANSPEELIRRARQQTVGGEASTP